MGIHLSAPPLLTPDDNIHSPPASTELYISIPNSEIPVSTFEKVSDRRAVATEILGKKNGNHGEKIGNLGVWNGNMPLQI